MKINNRLNSINNNTTFKSCDISQLNKNIIREHVEWDNLYSEVESLTNLQVNQKIDEIWQKIIEIYNSYKDNKKIKIVISSFKDYLEYHNDGRIQATVGLEGSEKSEKVVSLISDFSLKEKIDQEAQYL